MQTRLLETDLIEEPEPTVTRQVDIDAPVEEVWEAVSTDEGREGWLEYEADRELVVEHSDPPRRIAWWWWSGEQAARHVDIRVVSIPAGTRVFVTETAPATLPIATMAGSLAGQLAYA